MIRVGAAAGTGSGAIAALGPAAHPRVFHTLDGLRGIAALAIVLRHCDGFFGPGVLPGSYLAVDLFFVLSGFVIAFAYEDRLAQGLSPGRFVWLRFVRLYPLYILGIGLALLGELADGGWASPGFVQSLACAALMLPSPGAPGMAHPYLYPLNLPAWSLFFELAINTLYALIAPVLTRGRLAAIIGAAALALVVTAFGFGDLNVGVAWDTVLGGWARVTYSFFAGVLLFRLLRPAPRARHARPLWPWLIVLALLPLFRLDPSGTARILYDLACALLILPLLALAGAVAQPGPRTAGLFRWLGLVSYAVYALHLPTYHLVHGALDRLSPALLNGWSRTVGIAFVLALLGACTLIHRHYDAPLRRRLARIGAPAPAPARHLPPPWRDAA